MHNFFSFHRLANSSLFSILGVLYFDLVGWYLYSAAVRWLGRVAVVLSMRICMIDRMQLTRPGLRCAPCLCKLLLFGIISASFEARYFVLCPMSKADTSFDDSFEHPSLLHRLTSVTCLTHILFVWFDWCISHQLLLRRLTFAPCLMHTPFRLT